MAQSVWGLGYWLDDRGSIPGRGWEFFSSPPRPARLWGPQRPGCEADNLPLPSAEGKNAWSCTSNSRIRLRGVVFN
jgi:hypothetical protein